jgi:hypothetical protein
MRVARLDWRRVERQLADSGYARLPGLLSADECGALARLYDDDTRFRTTIDLERHRFGAGEYKYFAYPLPRLVARLRTHLYAKLVPVANACCEALGHEQRYPASLSRFLEECRARGQTRPTPLLLRYRTHGYNRLHQDLYGAVAFPLQVACLLSDPRREFSGGEFLLVEQRPRMQSRGESVTLARGEAIVFPTRERPVRSARGVSRAQMRHGVSRITSGERLTLGIIFHDAR